MDLLKRITIFILLLNLSGCYFVSFEDVTNIQPYSQFAGKSYISTQETFIDLISMHPDYKPTPSEYVIREREFALGPEVLSRSKLPKGTIFTVSKVLRCTDCYLDFSERIKLHVQLNTDSSYNDTFVTISDKLIGHIYVEQKAANN